MTGTLRPDSDRTNGSRSLPGITSPPVRCASWSSSWRFTARDLNSSTDASVDQPASQLPTGTASAVRTSTWTRCGPDARGVNKVL